jgi:hypothetical protein
LPEALQGAPRFLDADILEASFVSFAGCAALGEGQAAAIPGVAAHVDGPPEAIAADAVHAAQLASIEDATAEAFQRIFNLHKGRGPGRPRGGGRRQGDHASKGPPAPLSHIARGHVGVAKKRLLAVERHSASLRLGYAKLATAWNAAHGLRGGERVVTAKARRTLRTMQASAQLPGGWQPRKWSTDGFIKFAVAGVGKKVCNTSGVGGSTKNLAAVTCLAQMLQELQVAKLNILVKKLAAHACKTLVITRAYDCTPVLVNLGRYKSQLAPFARYVVKASDKSPLKSFADYNWGTGRAIPSFGVIELMGREVTIHCAAKGRLLKHRFIVAPLDMEARAKGEGGGTGFA